MSEGSRAFVRALRRQAGMVWYLCSNEEREKLAVAPMPSPLEAQLALNMGDTDTLCLVFVIELARFGAKFALN